MNKAETRAKYGEEQVRLWRRSYDVPPPGGESLEMTAARAIPYFDKEILPKVHCGQNLLVAAHGNSLRSIMMDLHKLTKEQVLQLEVPTGMPLVYEFSGKSFKMIRGGEIIPTG